MSRIRTVKPELFKHEALFDAELNSKLPLRLAFIGLFTVADCEGRFKWRPRTLKLDVLPHDFVDFASVMNALESAGFIERYEVDGEVYGWIPSFTKHQRLQTKELAAGSTIPSPNDRDATGTHPERYRDASRITGREGKRKARRKRRRARTKPNLRSLRNGSPTAAPTPCWKSRASPATLPKPAWTNSGCTGEKTANAAPAGKPRSSTA